MGEIQRWVIAAPQPELTEADPKYPRPNHLVMWPDHERVVAEKDARIKELEGQLSGLILEADKYADLDPYLDELLAGLAGSKRKGGSDG